MITVIGEALIDLVGDDQGVFRAKPGGAPFNVAIGLARLGVPTALLARLSQDSFGAQLRAHLADNGVSTRYAVTASEPTTLAFVFLDPHGSPRFEFYCNGTADWQWTAQELPDPFPDEVTAVHTGSLALALEPGAGVLEKRLAREHDRGTVTISLDPNVRPHLQPDRDAARDRVEAQLGSAHLVKVSADDLGYLYPGTAPADVVHRWCERGPALVVVTLGADGAFAMGPAQPRVDVTAPVVPVVDAVGAGDAFSAALLAGLHDNDLLAALRQPHPPTLPEDTLRGLLTRAGTAAALTCTRPGADPPRADELADVIL
ncbi:carbohydrate kinase family protein [Actinopolymorpha singaporensis]|uniref:Fructokinase n=1 Tax=Actinopolymorpha singaporensis TaxID=117157 RepID=A0A1H1LCN1_9ACTN|nr:carbohydrate kinase [Actinopolymorpha singaporensis]SDR72256.1 fructokinase [Actinopolymorpha singaporensis]